MRVPVEWLRELIGIPEIESARDIGEQLVRCGFEVEGVEESGAGLSGPLVVGRVVSIEELTDFKKPIRWCQVDTGDGALRGVICGARNFAAGDLVIVAPPGTTLPGGFHITARETYGHTSNGMICSERELGLGDNHDGIIVLAEGSPGDDGAKVMGIGDAVLDIAVTPDRGYALSMRGIAREASIAYGLDFVDPGLALAELPAPDAQRPPHESGSDALDACALLTLRTIRGFDPSAPTPGWMKSRLTAAGMRPVSLAVDVTNYVMLEIGQPLHAFDESKVVGVVRAGWARPTETLETLDHVVRALHEEDLVIRDDRGPLGLAGTMGGRHSEIDDSTTDIVLEAAWFDPRVVSRMARRHKLNSEASRRFERGVDRVLAPYASARAASLLLEFGGGTYAGMTAVEAAWDRPTIAMAADLAQRTAGCEIPVSECIEALARVGCEVSPDGDVLKVLPPAWRPDLTDPADCVEEVLRLHGFDRIPARLPMAPPGFGRTPIQRLRRVVGITMAAMGCVEVLNYPFMSVSDFEALRLPSDDLRRRTPVLANPLSAEAPFMRSTLLPGVLAAARRNRGRGLEDIAIWELGRVFVLRAGQPAEGSVDPIRPSVAHRPSDQDFEALEALLPDQPQHLAAVWCGQIEPSGWWGAGRNAEWSDAVDAALRVISSAGAEATVVPAGDSAFHPGRTGQLMIAGTVIGHAGELHPATCAHFGIAPRSVAFEIDLDALAAFASLPAAPEFSTAPVAKEDLALVVPAHVRAADVAATLQMAGGILVEDVRLFDVYEGPQVPAGHRSLAFALRLRAHGRTLTPEEIAGVRAAAIGAAAAAHGATLR
ncbi:unannotated protein [freshwater metagenome]|uniref:Phenylalanine--tRNA ligase beta subunit n=1 Tax=freshwater metagenome TaxID=449393 RepID=A0A6J7H935_9ZZZZ|nr:phenylalanine--tRNA ligase subunit beta [Actinomycetota bacterium]